MAFAEDLSVFFDTADFAEDALWTDSVGGAPLAGVVIFDRDGVILGNEDLQTTAPAALVPVSQWPLLTVGDTIDIDLETGLETFLVRSVLPQGDGRVALLALAKV